MLKLIQLKRHQDKRGFFAETYSAVRYKEVGIKDDFVQDNRSFSHIEGTLRGLHFQAPPHAQGKLVYCGRGAIFDVAVDIRQGSPTYGHWEGYELTSTNDQQLYIPVGFAHGFLSLKHNSEIVYKCSNYYVPDSEGTIRWDSCGIEWPLSGNPILSDKDKLAPILADLDSPFVYGENS